MKHWKIICAGIALLTAAACTQEQSQKPQGTTAPDAAATAAAPPRSGPRMKVFALGHPISGEPATEWELYEEFAYDSAGREIEHKMYYSGATNVVLTTYDAQGHELLVVQSSSLKASNIEFRSTWSADFLTQTTEEYSQEEGHVVGKKVRTLDAAGKLLRVEEEDLHVPGYPQRHASRLVYDAQGRLVEERESVGGKEIVGVRYTYDGAGHPVQIERYNAEGKPSQIEYYAYDAQGRKATRHFQDLSAYISSKQLQARYEYDTAGRLVKELHYGGQCDQQGEASGGCMIHETITMTYDAQGRMLTEERDRSAGSPKFLKKRFEYEGTTLQVGK
jgi:hypothetical protein